MLPAVLPRASKLAVAGRATLVPAGDRANDMPVRALPAVDGRDGAMRAPAIVAMMSSWGEWCLRAKRVTRLSKMGRAPARD